MVSHVSWPLFAQLVLSEGEGLSLYLFLFSPFRHKRGPGCLSPSSTFQQLLPLWSLDLGPLKLFRMTIVCLFGLGWQSANFTF